MTRSSLLDRLAREKGVLWATLDRGDDQTLESYIRSGVGFEHCVTLHNRGMWLQYSDISYDDGDVEGMLELARQAARGAGRE